MGVLGPLGPSTRPADGQPAAPGRRRSRRTPLEHSNHNRSRLVIDPGAGELFAGCVTFAESAPWVGLRRCRSVAPKLRSAPVITGQGGDGAQAPEQQQGRDDRTVSTGKSEQGTGSDQHSSQDDVWLPSHSNIPAAGLTGEPARVAVQVGSHSFGSGPALGRVRTRWPGLRARRAFRAGSQSSRSTRTRYVLRRERRRTTWNLQDPATRRSVIAVCPVGAPSPRTR